MPTYRIVDKPTPYQWARPAGEAGKVSWGVFHTPEGGGNILGTVGYLTGRANAGRVGYHCVVSAGGVVYRLAHWQNWVGHAGVGTAIPGVPAVRNVRVNYRTVSIAADNKAGFPPSRLAVVVAAQLAADACIELGLPDAGVWLGHREVSTVPGRRSDPTGVDMEEWRQLVHDALERRRTV